MRTLKTVFDFYINSSIHVALAVVALSGITYLEFNLTFDFNVLCFTGFAAIIGYNFVKYFGLAKFHYRRLSTRLKAIQVLSLFCVLVMVYFALKLKSATLIYIIIFAVITFLYAIPLLPSRFFIDKKKKLRSIGGLKVYVIAFVWSGVTVISPLINSNYGINDDVVISAVQRFVFVVVLMLPFEIRDLNYDSLQLATIPQKIGVKQTKIIGYFLLLVIIVLEFFKNDINQDYLISLVVITVVTLFFIKRSTKQQGKYFSSFWVESIPIWWFVCLLMFS